MLHYTAAKNFALWGKTPKPSTMKYKISKENHRRIICCSPSSIFPVLCHLFSFHQDFFSQ